MSWVFDTIVLAADGGGTRCRLAVSDGATVAQVEVGAANASTDLTAACTQISLGIRRLSDKTGLSPETLAQAPAFLGLAGVVGRDIADSLAAALPFARVRIEDDRASALRGALGAQDGYVAHCGTGSFFAVQRGRHTRFSDGWGPILGDQASAQWIGRRALAMTLESVDGLHAGSALSEALLAQYGGSAGIVNMASNMTPAAFGEIAPKVTSLAEQDDVLAVSLMQSAADFLADRLIDLGWRPGLTICLTGGIGPRYAHYLPKDMQAALADPLGDPLSGAIALAHAFKEEIENERC